MIKSLEIFHFSDEESELKINDLLTFTLLRSETPRPESAAPFRPASSPDGLSSGLQKARMPKLENKTFLLLS